MNEDDRKYLDILQAAITRMASNSFQLKSWSVALGSVIIGLSAKDAQPQLAVLALLPVIVFCFLDAYYLALERNLRELYERYTGTGEANADPPPPYTMKAGERSFSVLETMKSGSVWLVHGTIVVMAIVVALWGVKCRGGSCGFFSPPPAAGAIPTPRAH